MKSTDVGTILVTWPDNHRVGTVSQPAERHPDNAAGDFYVECDSCVSCEAPYHEAPDLMGRPGSSANNYGCFFRKQPSSPEEIDRACSAVMVSCVEAVRYAGNHPQILRKLYDHGAYSSCDVAPTDLERRVVQHVKEHYSLANQHGVHWTYIREESTDRVLVACCYGPYQHTLGIFTVDKATRQINIIQDDAEFRPARFDNYKRPKQGRWSWLPFTRRKAT